MSTDVLERSDVDDVAPIMQWRGSDDAITWTPWSPLHSVLQRVEWFNFYQGRVLVDGEWLTTPVTWDEKGGF